MESDIDTRWRHSVKYQGAAIAATWRHSNKAEAYLLRLQHSRIKWKTHNTVHRPHPTVSAATRYDWHGGQSGGPLHIAEINENFY